MYDYIRICYLCMKELYLMLSQRCNRASGTCLYYKLIYIQTTCVIYVPLRQYPHNIQYRFGRTLFYIKLPSWSKRVLQGGYKENESSSRHNEQVRETKRIFQNLAYVLIEVLALRSPSAWFICVLYIHPDLCVNQQSFFAHISISKYYQAHLPMKLIMKVNFLKAAVSIFMTSRMQLCND